MYYNSTVTLEQATLNRNVGSTKASEKDRLLRLSMEREERQPTSAPKAPGLTAGAAALVTSLKSLEVLRHALHHPA